MVTPSESKRLLLLVKPSRCGSTEGLDAFRDLLQVDTTGCVLRFIQGEIQRTEGQVRGGLAYVLAEHYCGKGDLPRLQGLFETDDALMKKFVLNGLWGRPGPQAGMAEGIVAMAIEAILTGRRSAHPGVFCSPGSVRLGCGCPHSNRTFSPGYRRSGSLRSVQQRMRWATSRNGSTTLPQQFRACDRI